MGNNITDVSTIVNIVSACISFLSFIGTIITASITIHKTERHKFYEAQEKLLERRNSLIELNMDDNYNTEHLNKYSLCEHNYLNCLDDICKRFSRRWILNSDIKIDLLIVKKNMSEKIEQSPSLQKTLKRCKL